MYIYTCVFVRVHVLSSFAEGSVSASQPVQLFQSIAQFGSISAFAFNRRRNLIAVAEKCAVPKVFLYSFPELQLLGSISGTQLDSLRSVLHDCMHVCCVAVSCGAWVYFSVIVVPCMHVLLGCRQMLFFVCDLCPP